MPLKKYLKFNIKGTASEPANLSRYKCDLSEPGSWKIADRNTYQSDVDPDGAGYKNVVIYVYDDGVKVCAPEPPFNQGDGPIRKRKKPTAKKGTKKTSKKASSKTESVKNKSVVKKASKKTAPKRDKPTVKKAVKKASRKVALKRSKPIVKKGAVKAAKTVSRKVSKKVVSKKSSATGRGRKPK
ncbi:MAG: hypothetical protein ABI851_15965 [Saprospiraceae bacterium]